MANSAPLIANNHHISIEQLVKTSKSNRVTENFSSRYPRLFLLALRDRITMIMMRMTNKSPISTKTSSPVLKSSMAMNDDFTSLARFTSSTSDTRPYSSYTFSRKTKSLTLRTRSANEHAPIRFFDGMGFTSFTVSVSAMR